MKIRKKIFLSGRVQGVGMRYEGKGKAEALGLKGSIRNLKDGRVEIMAEGEPEKIKALIDWLRKSSPGRVQRIEETEDSSIRSFQGFEIIY